MAYQKYDFSKILNSVEVGRNDSLHKSDSQWQRQAFPLGGARLYHRGPVWPRGKAPVEGLGDEAETFCRADTVFVYRFLLQQKRSKLDNFAQFTS